MLPLGYEVRVDPTTVAEWPTERREVYLIRPEVRNPLSVDRMVWPLASEHSDHPYGIWPNFLEAQAAAIGLQANGLNPWIVRVDVGGQCAGRWHPILEGSLPSDLDLSYKTALLGYDVADQYFISGLSNCGRMNYDADAFKRQWSRCLNDNGLFMELPDAQAYAEDCDRAIPQHAPFCAYGILRCDWMRTR